MLLETDIEEEPSPAGEKLQVSNAEIISMNETDNNRYKEISSN